MFHGIGYGIECVGVTLLALGAARLLRAPALAAKRAAALAASRPPEERDRYARGLTDFYRISGALAVAGGAILVLVPIFAG